MYTNGFVLTYLYKEFSATQQSWVPYAYASILALIGMVIAFKLERFLIIAVTSFTGAYAVGFGVIRLAWKSTHSDIGPLYLFSAPGCRDAFCKVRFSRASPLLFVCHLLWLWAALDTNNYVVFCSGHFCAL